MSLVCIPKIKEWITKSKAFGEEIIIYYETREDGVFLLPGTWGIYPWFEEDGEELIELLYYWRQQIFLYYDGNATIRYLYI